MPPQPLESIKQREERKRELDWNPAERWRLIQEMIAWADAQAAVPRNSRARCLELQRAKNRFTETSYNVSHNLGCNRSESAFLPDLG